MNTLPENISKGSDLSAYWRAFLDQSSEPAYKRIYLHYYHYFSYLGGKKGFDADVVQDAINELFLYLWENAGRLTHIKNHHNYLTTSFLRKLYKNSNAETENVTELTQLPESLIVPSAETLHIYNHLSDKFTRTVAKIVDDLPERQRLMIYQKFYLNLSYDEIANTNQVSINTVYNTIYKAFAALRNHLTDDNLLYLSLIILLIHFFMFFSN